jgi:glutamine amidotransferase
MCRLFGFRSVLQSQVHHSLVSADNALGVQAEEHGDGWGVAYYVAGSPHIIKSPVTAVGDRLFHRVSGIATSETVVAHIRKATQGDHSTLNCHPFQFGRWVMAHNGDVPDFPQFREALTDLIPPVLSRFLLGDTDSELIFHLFLSYLQQETELHHRGTPVESVVRAMRRTTRAVREVADTGDADKRSLLTFLVSDGELLAGTQGGKELHYSTYKKRCPERDSCTFFSPECEEPRTEGHVNHLILSSEPLQGENVWTEMKEGAIVAVDRAMRFHRF